MSKERTITLNGQKVAAFDPIEFFGMTVIDPRVTLREDATAGPRRRNSKVRITRTTATFEPLVSEEWARRIHNRDW